MLFIVTTLNIQINKKLNKKYFCAKSSHSIFINTELPKKSGDC